MKKMNFVSKSPKPKFHPDKPLGFGQADGRVWALETIKLINRLAGRPLQNRHPDYGTLFSISTRTPLHLMELAGKELSNRVIKEAEIPRLIKYRKDITTLYLRILWRMVYNFNELKDGEIGWTEDDIARKDKPIRYYNGLGCGSSEEWALLMNTMDITREQGMWEMHHGKGMCVG